MGISRQIHSWGPRQLPAEWQGSCSGGIGQRIGGDFGVHPRPDEHLREGLQHFLHIMSPPYNYFSLLYEKTPETVNPGS